MSNESSDESLDSKYQSSRSEVISPNTYFMNRKYQLSPCDDLEWKPRRSEVIDILSDDDFGESIYTFRTTTKSNSKNISQNDILRNFCKIIKLAPERIDEYFKDHLDEILSDSHPEGNTILHIMAKHPWKYDAAIFSKLINLGIDINHENEYGETAFQIFSEKISNDNLTRIASVLNTDNTVQHVCTNNKAAHLSKLLKETDFNENDINLINELISGCEIQVTDSFLIDLLANPKITVRNLDLAETLLKAGIDPDVRFNRKSTALTLTLHHSDFDFQKQMSLLLLKYGADPNLEVNKRTPLIIIFENSLNKPAYGIDKMSELISIFIDTISDVNDRFMYNKSTILHLACATGCDEIVKLLLEKGADPNCENTDGITPLMCVVYACIMNNCELQHVTSLDSAIRDREATSKITHLFNIFDLLISHGADPNIINHRDRSALSLLFYESPDMNPDHLYPMVCRLLKVNAEVEPGLLALARRINNINWNENTNFSVFKKMFTELIKHPINKVCVDEVLGSILDIYPQMPKLSHDLIHQMLIYGLDPNEFNLLQKLLRQLKRKNDTRCEISVTISDFIKTSIMILNYGANPEEQFMYLRTDEQLQRIIIPVIRAFYKNKIQSTFHDITMRQLPKFYNRFMYHPDRLRVRILNSQRNLDENGYAKWLEQDAGWLEYLGIYNLESFREKMQEYAKFMD